MGVCMNTTTLTIETSITNGEKVLNLENLSTSTTKKRKNYLGYNLAIASYPSSNSNSNSIHTAESSSIDVCSYHNSSNSIMNDDSSVYKSSYSIIKLTRNNPIYAHLKLRTKKKQRASIAVY
jgi:hypothetical protein